MNIKQRMPKFYATLLVAVDGDESVADQLIDSLVNAGVTFSKKDYVGLAACFDWSESPQGMEYWEMLDDKVENALGVDYRTPDFMGCDCTACKLVVKLGATPDAIGVIGALGGMVEILPEEMIIDLVGRAREERLDAKEQQAKKYH